MLTLITALTAASALAQAAPATTTATTARTLKDVPGTTVEYYDVTGNDLKAINKSIEKQRPKGQGKQASAASINWNVDVGVSKRTTNGACVIQDAKLTFTSKVALPRLANEQTVAPDVRAGWQAYRANLENSTAADLWFVNDRLPQLRTALMAASCDNVANVFNQNIEQLKKDEGEFLRKLVAADAARARQAQKAAQGQRLPEGEY